MKQETNFETNYIDVGNADVRQQSISIEMSKSKKGLTLSRKIAFYIREPCVVER